jgi:predicted GNAT family acetyltransferase
LARGSRGPTFMAKEFRRMSEAVTVVNNEAAGRFEVRLGGDVAFTEYRLGDGTITLPHTVVPEAFAGRGVGGRLAEAALTYAREHGLAVIPTCPFIAGYIAKHPEWLGIVEPSRRDKLAPKA